MKRSKVLPVISALSIMLTLVLGSLCAEQRVSAAAEVTDYANTAVVQVEESTGVGWTQVGLNDVRISIVAADPQQPSRVYAGGYAEDTSPVQGSLFVSSDGGVTWTGSLRETPIGTRNHINHLRVDPFDHQTIYAGSQFGIYKSTDGGASWSQRNNGIPSIVAGSNMISGSTVDMVIAIAPTSPPTIYIANDDLGLYRSIDGAESWHKVDVGEESYPRATHVVVSPSSPETVYFSSGKGVFRSDDSGTSWKSLNVPAADDWWIAVDPRNARNVYVQGLKEYMSNYFGTRWLGYGGLWHSTDGGDNLRLVENSTNVQCIVFDTRSPNALFAVTRVADSHEYFVSWSRDNGRTWTNLGRPSQAYLASDCTTSSCLAIVNDHLWIGTGNGVWQRPLPTVSSDPYDDRFFPQTGFRVDNDAIWDYFNRRGGVNTFGYPVSRDFTLQGFTTQFFQRRIVQLDGQGRARLLNLLDQDIMPYTNINRTTLPGIDAALVASAPDPANAAATLAFVKAHAPDTFNGKPVNFYQTFINSVLLSTTFPNGDGNPALLPGLALELWGIPTSKPFVDPNNHNFIYQRFQRGIMHYDATCDCTQGLLLAHYFKSIMTGIDIPADLDSAAKDSRYYRQYWPTLPNWVRDPSSLPNTDLTNAFVR